ncbi:MAG TPA: NAD(P)H-dependent oxidoreductase [Flavisolibacter sp.]
MEQTQLETGLLPKRIAQAMHWRHATKVFDKEKLVPDDQIDLLLETLRLSPSSIDMQPWKFLVINNKAVRKQLQSLAMNQPQVTEASHLFLLCSLEKIDGAYYERLVQLEKQENGQHSSLAIFRSMAMAFIESKDSRELRHWMAEQVYIALGFLLSTCALLHIDACPIEGFDHAKVNKLLGLHNLGIESRIMVAIGYRPERSEYRNMPKLRWPKEEVVLTI